MDILKTAIEWAKDEVFSAQFFALFGVMFIIASFGFRQLAVTQTARAFIIPMLVAGVLLMVIGIGLVMVNRTRAGSFEEAYKADRAAFIQTEIERCEKTVSEFQTVVFTGIPLIVIAMALLIMFVDKPIWRASCITTIAMMAVIFLVDSNSKTRIENYHQALLSVATP